MSIVHYRDSFSKRVYLNIYPKPCNVLLRDGTPKTIGELMQHHRMGLSDLRQVDPRVECILKTRGKITISDRVE